MELTAVLECAARLAAQLPRVVNTEEQAVL